MLADGDRDPDGESEAEGEREAEVEALEGDCEADGDLDGEPDDEADAEGEIDELGLLDAEVTRSPISLKACPADKESLTFRMSKFVPNLKDP